MPGWSALQRCFEARAEARLAGKVPPPFPVRDAQAGALPGMRSRARFLRSLLRTFRLSTPTEQAEVVIFTLAGKRGPGVRDAYFGSLAAWLRGEKVSTVYLAAGAETTLPGGAARIPLESFASVGDVFEAWSEGERAELAMLPSEPDHAVLAARLARQEIASGEAFMHALMRRAFARMLATLRPRVLVYPFENRAWEKSLVAAARASGVKRIVGYQHSSITPRHLAFETTIGPLPDRVITVGAVTAQWLSERVPALAGRIAVGASLRRGTSGIPLPAAHGVLVAISSSRDEALALMQLVYAAVQSLQVPIVFRSHPTIPAADLFARFAWPGSVRLSSGTTLEQDFAAATMVAYSSSTVALEGMLHGRLPLFADIGDLPSADPLVGECPAKSVAGDSAALAELVDRICRMPGPELEERRASARRYAEDYLRNPDADRVQGIVAEILAGNSTR